MTDIAVTDIVTITCHLDGPSQTCNCTKTTAYHPLTSQISTDIVCVFMGTGTCQKLQSECVCMYLHLTKY